MFAGWITSHHPGAHVALETRRTSFNFLLYGRDLDLYDCLFSSSFHAGGCYLVSVFGVGVFAALNISGVLVAFISISILKKLQPQTSFWFTSTRIYSTHNRCTEDEIQAVMTPANRIIPQRDHCWIFLVVRTETKRKVVPGNESSFGSEVFVSLLSSGLKLIGSFLQHVVILLCFLCFTVCFASLPVLFCVNQRQGR